MTKVQTKVLTRLLEKIAFSPADAVGGQPPMDPAAAGGAPMDPAAMGGQPPMDPAMAGGQPPMDPAAAGGAPMDPAAGGQDMGGQDPMSMPISMLTVGDLIGLVGEVVTQAIGGGAPEGEAPAEAPAPEAPAAPEGASEGGATGDDDIVGRLDQILELLSAGMGAPAGGAPAPMVPMGPAAGAMAPEGPGPKLASTKLGNTSIADMILDKVGKL